MIINRSNTFQHGHVNVNKRFICCKTQTRRERGGTDEIEMPIH